jgi:hypothetical protein
MTDARFISKERVERDDVLVYAEGDEIPATDVDELVRQGYLTQKAAVPSANKAERAAANKARGARKST